MQLETPCWKRVVLVHKTNADCWSTFFTILSPGFDTNTRPYMPGADLATSLKVAGLTETSSTTISVPEAASDEALAAALLKIGTLSAELLEANNATLTAAAAAAAAAAEAQLEIDTLSAGLLEANNATETVAAAAAAAAAEAQLEIDTLAAGLLTRGATNTAAVVLKGLQPQIDDLLRTQLQLVQSLQTQINIVLTNEFVDFDAFITSGDLDQSLVDQSQNQYNGLLDIADLLPTQQVMHEVMHGQELQTDDLLLTQERQQLINSRLKPVVEGQQQLLNNLRQVAAEFPRFATPEFATPELDVLLNDTFVTQLKILGEGNFFSPISGQRLIDALLIYAMDLQNGFGNAIAVAEAAAEAAQLAINQTQTIFELREDVDRLNERILADNSTITGRGLHSSFSAQLRRFVWDKGCAKGFCSPC